MSYRGRKILPLAERYAGRKNDKNETKEKKHTLKKKAISLEIEENDWCDTCNAPIKRGCLNH